MSEAPQKQPFRLSQVYKSKKEFALDMLCNLLGAAMFSAGLMEFAQSNGLALGGLSGVALIINRITGFPVGITVLLLDIPLMIFSWRILGRFFLMKSIVSILIMTAMNDLIFARLPVYTGNPLLAALYCGALLGCGLGLIYSRGSSTGGTDFLVLPLHKLAPRFKLNQISMAIDAVIILCGGLFYNNIDSVLYGIVSAAVSATVMDRVLYGSRSEKIVLIITDDGMAVARRIAETIRRGSTNIDAVGTYTGQPKNVLLCACSRHEIVSVRHAVREVDPSALVMISEVSEAFGEGFQSQEGDAL